MRSALLVSILLLVAACDTTASLKQLRKTEVKGSPFQMRLALLYRDYAEQEMQSYDWWSSKYFADKGLMIAYGNDVGPEKPDAWEVPPGARKELDEARNELMNKLTEPLKELMPDRAAELQFYYDCWLEQLEEGWQSDDIEQCKHKFYELLNKEDTAVYDGPPIGGPMSSAYLLYFPWDSNKLDEVGSDGLLGISQQLINEPKAEIVIHGHADRSGSDDYNLMLSMERAEFIRKFMMERGIEPDRIQYYAFGESDPKVPTPDGVKERANRRVEIFIE